MLAGSFAGDSRSEADSPNHLRLFVGTKLEILRYRVPPERVTRPVDLLIGPIHQTRMRHDVIFITYLNGNIVRQSLPIAPDGKAASIVTVELTLEIAR